MKKNIRYFISILFIFYNCAPHTHYYKSLNKSDEDKLKIFCTKNDKIWIYNIDKNQNDTILIYSNNFKEFKNQPIMDTISYRETDSQKSFLIRINDNKFHKQIKNDNLFIKYKRDDIWVEEKFIIVNDNKIK
jgi:hypothetical protein